MNEIKYVVGVFFLFFLIFIIENSRSILPTMRWDEYFVDKYNDIHNNSCPYKDVPWFTIKHRKYDFLKKKEWEFCSVCFSKDEIKKLMVLHKININNEILRLERAGASEDYIEDKLMQYDAI